MIPQRYGQVWLYHGGTPLPQLLRPHGFKEHTPPLDNLAALAKAGVPLVHVCDRDDPWFNEQTRVVEQRYKELGGQITVIINESDGPRSFASPERTRAIDLIVAKANSK